MIEWYPDLYVDQKTEKKIKKIMARIEKGKPALNIYAICIPTNPNNLFDIINVNELLFRYYKRKTVRIVGLASGKDSAVHVLKDMIDDMLEKSGDLKPKEFFDTFL